MSEENKHLTPVWIVYVDGARLDTEHEGALKKIIVNDRMNGIGTCTLLFDSSAVKLRDAGTFVLESEISVHLGYKDDVEEVFNGEITGFRAVFAEYGHEEIEVSACNALYRLQHGMQYSSFTELSVSDVISGILDAHSLTAEVDTFGGVLPFQTQYGVSDYEYVMRAAALYGKEVYAYGQTVYVKDEVSVATDEIVFEWGKSLISFEGKQDVSKMLSDCSVTGWDSLKCEGCTGVAALSDLPVQVGGGTDWTGASNGGGGKWQSLILDRDVMDADDAKNRAIGTLQRNSFLFCRAEGRGEGNYKLHPGMRVQVKYVGETFSGEYIAETVTHEFNYTNGFTTAFGLKRNMCP